jgi:hypothetical protein
MLSRALTVGWIDADPEEKSGGVTADTPFYRVDSLHESERTAVPTGRAEAAAADDGGRLRSIHERLDGVVFPGDAYVAPSSRSRTTSGRWADAISVRSR